MIFFPGRIGGIIAPWVGKLSDVHPYLPVTIFGANAIIGTYNRPSWVGKLSDVHPLPVLTKSWHAVFGIMFIPLEPGMSVHMKLGNMFKIDKKLKKKTSSTSMRLKSRVSAENSAIKKTK